MVFDIATLVVSASFLAALLLFIAAPAIELNHAAGFAPRPIEYLARHGDHSGLWMLLPAIVVGYTLTDVKLLVFLVTAMLIETRWFLRHRLADRHRQLYPIEGHDLVVLQAQASWGYQEGSHDATVFENWFFRVMPWRGGVATRQHGLAPSIFTLTVLA